MPESTIVYTISLTIAAACIAGIIVIAFKQKRQTGRFPNLLGDTSSVWISLLGVYWVFLRPFMLQTFDRAAAPYVLGLDSALLLSSITILAWMLSLSFRSGWTWKTGLRQSASFILPMLFAWFVYQDVVNYMSGEWLWFLAAVQVALLTPFLIRLAYLDYGHLLNQDAARHARKADAPRLYRADRPGR